MRVLRDIAFTTILLCLIFDNWLYYETEPHALRLLLAFECWIVYWWAQAIEWSERNEDK